MSSFKKAKAGKSPKFELSSIEGFANLPDGDASIERPYVDDAEEVK